MQTTKTRNERIYEWLTEHPTGFRFTSRDIRAEVSDCNITQAAAACQRFEKEGAIVALGIKPHSNGCIIFEYVSHEPVRFNKSNCDRNLSGPRALHTLKRRGLSEIEIVGDQAIVVEHTKREKPTSEKLLDLILELEAYTKERKAEARKGNKGLPRITTSMRDKLLAIAVEIEQLESQVKHYGGHDIQAFVLPDQWPTYFTDTGETVQ